MVQDVVLAPAAHHLAGGEPGQPFRRPVPEGDPAVGVHEVNRLVEEVVQNLGKGDVQLRSSYLKHQAA
jgi:hypothetical protein